MTVEGAARQDRNGTPGDDKEQRHEDGSGRPTRWRPVGPGVGWRGSIVLAGATGLGLTWLLWPIWRSASSPGAMEAAEGAPAVLVALVSVLVLLAVASWLDAGRRFVPLSVGFGFLLATVLLRLALGPDAGGVELAHALPLLAGMTVGAPVGFLVGAGSGLWTAVLASQTGVLLPAHALILGLVGALGGLLWRLRPIAAWLCSLPLAVVAGLGSGVLLNLVVWAQQPGTSTISFYVGASPGLLVTRLWEYTVASSLSDDLTRGLSTLLLLLVVGLPILRAVRATGVGPAIPVTAGEPGASQSHATALARRQDRARLDTLWKTGDPS